LLAFNSHDFADLNNNAASCQELTAEFSTSTNVPSLPVTHLELYVGAPIMLLHNINCGQGLCNGSRMTVTCTIQHCVEVRLSGCKLNGQYHLLYRCKLTLTKNLFFLLTHVQFPV
jgi:hypothetical protein